MGLISGAAIHPPHMAIFAQNQLLFICWDWHLPGVFVLLTVVSLVRVCVRVAPEVWLSPKDASCFQSAL